MNRIDVYDLGFTPYRQAWDLQKSVQQRLIADKLRMRDEPGLQPAVNDQLLFVEHPHVYTLGKSGNAAHLLRGAAELRQIDAEFVQNDRGGDITYHGPGQIVGYPILNLDRYMTDIHKYLRSLEEVIIRVCGTYGLQAGRIDGLTGVWVGEQKVCAMGIRCSRWVTMHGFALNVNTDLSYFDHIVPCGIQDKRVTSLSALLARPVPEEEVREEIIRHFGEVFGARMERGSLENLPEHDSDFSYLATGHSDG
ncbi:MAG: lipoyl(octanoyl) transferase LipB [Balneolaceae bacterium]